jgi:hypothetical protein
MEYIQVGRKDCFFLTIITLIPKRREGSPTCLPRGSMWESSRKRSLGTLEDRPKARVTVAQETKGGEAREGDRGGAGTSSSLQWEVVGRLILK